MQINHNPMRGIRVRYLGMTNHLPARYKADDGERHTATVSAEESTPGDAALKLCLKMNWNPPYLTEFYYAGDLYYVMAPRNQWRPVIRQSPHHMIDALQNADE